MNGEESQELLNEKYHIDAVGLRRWTSSLVWVQGNMTVTEYAMKLDRFAKFIAELVPIDVT